jgi:rhodanese-related sulfurtransferase
MKIETITPDEAHRRMTGASHHRYLDVRSVEEFTQGHAEGAINIPIALMSGGGMSPNPNFMKVVQATIPKETPLVVGCQAGGRSGRACEMLAAAGYTTVANIDGGFGGRKDFIGRVAQKGWKDLGLPVSTDNSPGVSWESLSAKAK